MIHEQKLEDDPPIPNAAAGIVPHEGRTDTTQEATESTRGYVLYREDEPYYIGKTETTIFKRVKTHALRPNARRYNFWNYFSTFEINDDDHRDEVEATLIAAMPTATNSSRPKIERMRVDRDLAKLVNEIQAFTLTGEKNSIQEHNPEEVGDDEEE